VKKFTIISNDYIKGDSKLDSKKLFLFLILMQNRTTKDTCMFNVRYLCDRLDATTRNTNRTKYIIDTLKYFQEKQILFFSDKYNCIDEINIEKFITENKMDIVFAELYEPFEDNFTMIYDNEIDFILDYCKNNKINKYLIINLYLYILSYINNNEKDEDYKLCYPSIETLANELQISENTVLKYIDILKENKLLYYNNVGYKIVNGEYKMTNTYYCRYDDKEVLENKLDNIRQTKSINIMNKSDKMKTNNKRSLKQKINKLINKLNKTEEEVEKLKLLQEEYKQL
jgi:DNA-binding transcriptional regulator YhcF (GntR family)